MSRLPRAVSEYMAAIGARGGQKGGQATGKRKARAPEHYAKMVEARRTISRLAQKAKKARAKK